MPDTTTPKPATQTAGAFDIRNIIGALVGLYGLVLLGMGLFADPETAKTGGPNANLYAGIGMLVVGVLFLAWARLRPIVVPVESSPETSPETSPQSSPEAPSSGGPGGASGAGSH